MAFYFQNENQEYVLCQNNEQVRTWLLSEDLSDYNFKNTTQKICNVNKIDVDTKFKSLKILSESDLCKIDTGFNYNGAPISIINEDRIPVLNYDGEFNAYFIHPKDTSSQYERTDRQLYMSAGTSRFTSCTIEYDSEEQRIELQHTHPNTSQGNILIGPFIICAIQANGGGGADYFNNAQKQVGYVGGGGGSGAFCVFMCDVSRNAIKIQQIIDPNDAHKQKGIQVIINDTTLKGSTLFELHIYAGSDAPPINKQSGQDIIDHGGTVYGDGGTVLLHDCASSTEPDLTVPEDIKNKLNTHEKSGIYMMAITDGSHGGAGSLYSTSVGWDTNAGTIAESAIATYENLNLQPQQFSFKNTSQFPSKNYNYNMDGYGGISCMNFDYNSKDFTPGQGGNGGCSIGTAIRDRTAGHAGCIIIQAC